MDLVLYFGVRSAPYNFTRLSDLVEWRGATHLSQGLTGLAVKTIE